MVKTYPFTPDYIVEPGEHIKEFITFNQYTENTFAFLMSMNVTELRKLIYGKTRIDERIAKRLEFATDQCAEYWLNLESNYQTIKRRTKNG